MIETADSGVKRIGGAVDLLGRYSREGYSRVLQPYDAFAAVRDALSVVVPATGRGVTVETSFEGDGTLECVPEELNQVIGNLVQNAVEAAPEGAEGRVIVRGVGEEGHVVLTVSDNGPGIPPSERAKIFTPFHTTKEPGRGMGMGLTITRRVVQSLRGTIGIAGGPGEGAEVVVRLPRRQPAGRAGAQSSAPPGPVPATY
jgi:two-component system sensor histidine kinase PilS (NtrC family)